MSVYVITGVSRGLGFECLRQISEAAENVVVGLVRDKLATEKKVAAELGGRTNIHILHGDLEDYASLKQAAAATTDIVGGRGVDYLIANGCYLSLFDAYDAIGTLGAKPETLEAEFSKMMRTNVLGNIHLFNLFLPLVLKGRAKKVISMTSGHADIDFINKMEVDINPLYSISKAAMNTAVAKFNAQYGKDGVLFMSISPGAADVEHFTDVTPEQMERAMGFMGKLASYAPHFKSLAPVDETIRNVRSVWEKASIGGGFGGSFVSHYGNKQWL